MGPGISLYLKSTVFAHRSDHEQRSNGFSYFETWKTEIDELSMLPEIRVTLISLASALYGNDFRAFVKVLKLSLQRKSDWILELLSLEYLLMQYYRIFELNLLIWKLQTIYYAYRSYTQLYARIIVYLHTIHESAS